MEVKEEDREKAAISSHRDLYISVRMPFGLKNVTRTFQNIMDVILASFNRQYALVYFTDIGIFSKTHMKHIDHVKKVQTL